jgi:hypothetical protein
LLALDGGYGLGHKDVIAINPCREKDHRKLFHIPMQQSGVDMPDTRRLEFADPTLSDQSGWSALQVLAQAQDDLVEARAAVERAALAVNGTLDIISGMLLPHITPDMFPDRGDLEEEMDGGHGAQDDL